MPLLLGGQLVTSKDDSGCHHWGGSGPGIWGVKARDAVKHLTGQLYNVKTLYLVHLRFSYFRLSLSSPTVFWASFVKLLPPANQVISQSFVTVLCLCLSFFWGIVHMAKLTTSRA